MLVLGPLGAVVNGLQAVEGLVEVGGQLDEHRRHLVRTLGRVDVGPDRHRHHGHERLVGEFVAVDQERAQGAGANGQDDVVHRAPGGVLQPLDVVEPDGGEGHVAAPGEGGVERGPRGGQGEGGVRATGPVGGSQPDPADVEHPLAGPDHVTDHLEGTQGTGHPGLGHELERRGDPLVDRGLGSGLLGCRIGFEIEQHREQFGSRHPVDGRMVHLDDDPDITLGQSLHDPHLPQRSGPIELVTGDLAGQLGELEQPPGPGHRRPPDVVVDVEATVVHPHRVAEAERHLHQPAPEHRGGGDAVGDPLLHPLERVAVRNRRRVEDEGHGHVHVEARGLEIEEAGIESAESFHRRPFLSGRQGLALRPARSFPAPALMAAPPGPVGFTSLVGPCLMEGWPGCSSQSALPSRSSWSTPTTR